MVSVIQRGKSAKVRIFRNASSSVFKEYCITDTEVIIEDNINYITH